MENHCCHVENWTSIQHWVTQGILKKIELFKSRRFNADKCNNVLIETRNTATRRTVFWGVMLGSAKTWQEFPKRCRGRLGSLDKGTGVQQGIPLCGKCWHPPRTPHAALKSTILRVWIEKWVRIRKNKHWKVFLWVFARSILRLYSLKRTEYWKIT